MINLPLLIIARALQLVCSPILIVWGLIRSTQRNEFLQWSNNLAIAIDRFGNCLGKYTWNDLLGDGFGNSKETISSRLGKNKVYETLKKCGKFVAKILDKLDKNHCIKSIDINI
jgi:hypothetical protein